MAVSGGYPGSYAKGFEIRGLDGAGGIVFHAGTAVDADGRTVTAGGRVLAAVNLADDIASAAAMSYDALRGIAFEGMRYRSDIGRDLMKF